MKPKKALILTAKFGGGHRNSARILANLLAEHGIPHAIWEVTDHQPKFRGKSLQEWYYYLTAVKFPLLWELTVYIGQITPRPIFLAFFGLFTNQALRRALVEEKPDMVISTYGHLSALVEGIDPKLKTLTVVSDTFTPVFYWFLARRDKLVVMSREVAEYALGRGISPDRLLQIEPMVHPKFLQRLDPALKTAMKHDLRLNDKPTVLVIGGGEGLPRGERIVRTILDSDLDLNLLVICSKDEHFRQRLERLKTRYPDKILHVFGFIDQVYEVMNLADVVISKAGPATILESLALGKPILLTTYYPQEKGNKDFVVNNKYGVYQPWIDRLPATIQDILDNHSKNGSYWQPVDESQKLIPLID